MRTLGGLKDKVWKYNFVEYLTQIVLVQGEYSVVGLPRGSYKTNRVDSDPKNKYISEEWMKKI
jgi:hypothetical protein